MSEDNKQVAETVKQPLIECEYNPAAGERYNPLKRPLEAKGGDGLTRQ